MFRDDLLKGQRILVTGGGTGLGRAMTARFMALGADCVIWGRRGGVLNATAAELADATGGTCAGMAVDIRNPAAIDEAMEAIFADRPLTGLVNNAAGNFISRTEDLSANAFNSIASIVAHGTFNTTVAAGKRWIAAGLPASVLSIVTSWVWNGGPFTVPSAMSKAGVAVMTKSLAVEWGPKGIRLNAIAPGPFPTEGAWARLMPAGMMDKTGMSGDGAADIPLRRVGEHAELANLATFLMAPGCDYLTGEVIAIDGAQWLASAGNFHTLSRLDDEDWTGIRAAIQATNAADRANRTA